MRILILGGTVFLGRHLTETLLSRGHDVTLFNRGQQNSRLFPAAEKLRGNRDGNLSALAFRNWDVVIDTCGFFPRQVEASTRQLRSYSTRYVYISSVNQYADFCIPNVNEAHPSDTTPLSPDSPLTAVTYGPLKAACEAVVRQVYDDDALILRPGCMIGPYDQAHRFTYWVQRTAAGGPMLVPGRPEQAWQVIDVRDVVEWLVRMIEQEHTGTYNVVGAQKPYLAQALMAELANELNSKTQPIWTDTTFLRNVTGGERWLDLAEWTDLSKKWTHLYAVDNTRAIKQGLYFRPLAETAHDVRTWLAERGPRDADALELDHERNTLKVWEQNLKRPATALRF